MSKNTKKVSLSKVLEDESQLSMDDENLNNFQINVQKSDRNLVEEEKTPHKPQSNNSQIRKVNTSMQFSKIVEEEFKEEQLDFEDPFNFEEDKQEKSEFDYDLRSIMMTNRSIAQDPPKTDKSLSKSMFTSRHDVEESKAQIDMNANNPQEVENSLVESIGDHLEVPAPSDKKSIPNTPAKISEIEDWDISKLDKSHQSDWKVASESDVQPENAKMAKKSTLEQTVSKSKESQEEEKQVETSQDQHPVEPDPVKSPEELKQEKKIEQKKKEIERKKKIKEAAKNFDIGNPKSIKNMLKNMLGED